MGSHCVLVAGIVWCSVIQEQQLLFLGFTGRDSVWGCELRQSVAVCGGIYKPTQRFPACCSTPPCTQPHICVNRAGDQVRWVSFGEVEDAERRRDWLERYVWTGANSSTQV